ncbi:unnamed protein product, partial [Lampetra fluviatilis]
LVTLTLLAMLCHCCPAGARTRGRGFQPPRPRPGSYDVTLKLALKMRGDVRVALVTWEISRLETTWRALGRFSHELRELRMREEEREEEEVGAPGEKVLAGTATGSALARSLRVLAKDLDALLLRMRIQLSSLGAEPQPGGPAPSAPGHAPSAPGHAPPRSQGSLDLQGFLVLRELGAWLQRLGRDLARLRLLPA